MLSTIYQFIIQFDEIFWGYVAFVVIMIFGLFLSFRAGFFQIRALPGIILMFIRFLKQSSVGKRGVHPLKAFFASTGGMIGIGNVVGIVTAVQIGGPGSVVWVWIAAMIGAIVKYSEVYLGFKFRVPNKEGGYDGGPMYFLKKAFKNPLIPMGVAFLLCIYGVEIYQFVVIADSIATNWFVPRIVVIVLLLIGVLFASIGGVQRIGKICAWVMPFFMVVYMLMGLWVIISEIHILPSILANVFLSAFTGHAAVGGFAGASVALAIQQGVSRAAYSSDIGVGYDSIIQSESSTVHPERQARLAILGVFVDNMICTFSIFIVLISGVWHAAEPIEGSQLIQVALSNYFPFMEFFIPIFFIVTGYTTIIAYLVVGIKCARYLAPTWGKQVYIFYAVAPFVFFSYIPQTNALLVMSISGALLLTINFLGILRLRREIAFSEELKLEDLEVKEAA